MSPSSTSTMNASFVADVIVHSEGVWSSKGADTQVSPRYRSRVRKCQAGTGATLSSMNRNFTVYR